MLPGCRWMTKWSIMSIFWIQHSQLQNEPFAVFLRIIKHERVFGFQRPWSPSCWALSSYPSKPYHPRERQSPRYWLLFSSKFHMGFFILHIYVFLRWVILNTSLRLNLNFYVLCNTSPQNISLLSIYSPDMPKFWWCWFLKQQATAAAPAAATPESQTGHANEAPSTPEIHQ